MENKKLINKKKVCFVTSTRADYGLLKDLIKKSYKEKNIITKVIACGTHFSPKFGSTFKEIMHDKIKIDFAIKIKIDDDSPFGSSSYFSKFSHELNKTIKQVKPNILILLGDRFEILAAASIAVIHRIPICHLHGGEETLGAIDNSIRHAITQLSSIHFVSHKRHKSKVIKMGAETKNVHYVGALGLNSIKKNNKIKKSKIEKLINNKLNSKRLIVTYHPVTLVKNSNKDIIELLNAIKYFNFVTFLFTAPNMDTNHNHIINKILKFVKSNKNSCFVKSLGKDLYIKTLKNFDGIVGNSSSGIIEVSTFKKGTVNIGKRQEGRIQPKSVINCKPLKKDIILSIKKLLSSKFKKKLKKIKNPYYMKGTEDRILSIIKKFI